MLEEILFNEKHKSYANYSNFYKIPMLDAIARTKHEKNNFYPDSNKRSFTNIIKLHGSINWLYGENINTIYYPTTYNEIAYMGLTPFIVPPILDKTNEYQHSIMKMLWRQAYISMQKAKNIYIYGFSFPMTDLSVIYLFQHALYSNKDYKIYVINTENDIDNKKKRYNEIFGEGKCNFDLCCNDNLEKLADHLNGKLSKNI